MAGSCGGSEGRAQSTRHLAPPILPLPSAPRQPKSQARPSLFFWPLRGGDGRISQVPEEPRLPVCHVQSTPAGLRAQDQYGAAAWPLVCEQQRLPRKVFRRSIAWLSGSLPALRRAGYPAPTQDSLPAVGQTLLDGLSPGGLRRKVSGCFLHPILLSQACLAQAHRPPHRTARGHTGPRARAPSPLAASAGPALFCGRAKSARPGYAVMCQRAT
jgi:hypothetical protein